MTSSLDDLAQTYWDTQLAADPLTASLLGDHRFDEELPDLSGEAEERRLGTLRELVAAADAMPLEGCGDPVSLQVLRHEAAGAIRELEARAATFRVSAAVVGPQIALFEACPRLTLPEREHAAALLTRYRQIPRYFTTAVERLREGLAAGRAPVARAVRQVINQIDGYLASPLQGDPFCAPAPPPAFSAQEREGWRTALEQVVTDHVRPGFLRYREALAEELRPVARPDDRCGLRWLPDGEALYGAAIGRFLPGGTDPQTLHELGREHAATFAEEYRRIAPTVLGTDDLNEIMSRLRDDSSLRFRSAGEVRELAEWAVRRAQDAVPSWFGRLPRSPCAVVPMGPHEERDGTIAYYLPPAEDGTRPGTYVVNTHLLHTCSRFEAEALAFHEAVPGHHLQLGLSQELDLPAFRRHALVYAYVEGWALYTERLAEEMGLYSSDLDRLGMLAFDSWRSGRLVVDTGLHHLGWSREQAIGYLQEHSPLAPANIANEVDRYIAWPGQALSYTVGKQHLLRLREQARRQLGSAFDIRAFHDLVLGQGPVPLAVLSSMVDDWLASRP